MAQTPLNGHRLRTCCTASRTCCELSVGGVVQHVHRRCPCSGL